MNFLQSSSSLLYDLKNLTDSDTEETKVKYVNFEALRVVGPDQFYHGAVPLDDPRAHNIVGQGLQQMVRIIDKFWFLTSRQISDATATTTTQL